VLHITDETVIRFQSLGRERLALDIVQHIPTVTSVDAARRYVEEGWLAGLRTDQELAEFALLLADVDRAGRPPEIDALVKDNSTHSQLKLFQLRYALSGGRP
jgi:hypothetical protein